MKILIQTPTEPYKLPWPDVDVWFIPTETLYCIDVPETTTILSIKYIIQDKEKIQHSSQRLLYNGRELEDSQILTDLEDPFSPYGVHHRLGQALPECHGCPVLMLIFRMRG